MRDSMTHQGRANALPLMLTGDLGIEQEGVIASVPRHVNNADQAATAHASGHPAKAAGPDLVPPASRGLATMRSDQRHHFRVGDWSAPAVLNRLGRHMRIVQQAGRGRQNPNTAGLPGAPAPGHIQRLISQAITGAHIAVFLAFDCPARGQ